VTRVRSFSLETENVIGTNLPTASIFVYAWRDSFTAVSAIQKIERRRLSIVPPSKTNRLGPDAVIRAGRIVYSTRVTLPAAPTAKWYSPD
jgi:hypothetical protein